MRRNPQIAPQTPDINNDFLATGQDALKFIMGEVGSAMQTVLSAARQQSQNPMIPTVLTGDETDEQMAAIRAANKARKQTEKQQEQDEERQLRASERRSMAPIEQARGENDDDFDAPEMETALPDLDDEDSLLNTPEQLGRQLELDETPPRGLLFSSPSRRRSRRTDLRDHMPESPARNSKEMRPPDIETREAPPGNDKVSESELLREKESQVLPPLEEDPETLAKKVEKEKLQLELRTLQDEVQGYTRHVEQVEGETEDDVSDLVQLTISTKSVGMKPIQEPETLSSLLTSFLPFSIPLLQPESTLNEIKPIPSQFPIQQSDPLPLLTLFTPLKFNSIIDPPSNPSSSTEAIKQTHHITLTGPASILSCNLDLTVSSSPTEPGAPSVESLYMSNLSPWVSAEIGPFLQKRANEGDINTIGYALARYWDINLKRAQCWSRCCKEFRHLLTLSKELHGRTEEEEEVSSLRLPAPSRRELLPHIGRQFLLFQTSSVVLRIEWKLDFDWTGEVESVVSAKAGLPKVCRLFRFIYTSDYNTCQ